MFTEPVIDETESFETALPVRLSVRCEEPAPSPLPLGRPSISSAMLAEAGVRDVEDVYQILGDDAVLLALPRGIKYPVADGWQKTTLATSRTPEYQQTLARSDLGVLLGRAGNGNCSIDCDCDDAAAALLASNPRFAETFQTRGARGRNFWLRITGDVPKSCNLSADGVKLGEWRADGNQTKISGTHPDTGNPYQWLTTTEPLNLAFTDIVWPVGWTADCIKTDFDRLIATWGEAGFFTTDEKTGVNSLRGLNQPHWAARLALVFDCLFEPSENQFYAYEPTRGLWTPKTKATLKTALAAELRTWGIKNRVESAVILKLSDRLLSDVLRQTEGVVEAKDAFTRPRKLIHTFNGMVDSAASPPALLPFSREYFSRNQTPVSWVDSSKCPRFYEQLLGSALDADDRSLLQRWIGSILLGGNRAQRLMLLTGTAGGGKGTLMEIIEHIVGSENVAQLRTALLAERFELGRVVGRTLLCGKDVDADFLQQKGAHVIKALVGHDLLTGERKGGNGVINFRGEFAVAITANSRLRVRLQGDISAWRRRLISIVYEKPKPEHRIENFARLLLAEEGPGILRWAAEGASLHLKELEEHGDFQLTPAQIHRVDALLSESDSLRRFAEEHLTADLASDVTVSEIVESYVGFCESMNWSPLAENAVQRALPDIMLDLFRASRRQDIKRDGRSQRGFKGVVLTIGGNPHGA